MFAAYCFDVVGRVLRVVDVYNINALFASRCLHSNFGVQRFADQGACQRRVDADQPLFQVQFIWPDDAIARLFAFFIFNGDPGAKIDFVRIAGLLADDLQCFQPFGEKTHATVDLAQHFFAVGVLALLLKPYCYPSFPFYVMLDLSQITTSLVVRFT